MPNVSGFGVPAPRSCQHKLSLVLFALSIVAGFSSRAEARGRSAKPKGAAAQSPRNNEGPGTGKIAVFAFDGDEATNVHKHVVQVLSNQGLRVDTSLRPVQTAEEFRDMGATLDLAAYVQGHIKELSGDKAQATIVVRSGVTGRAIATTTITGFRRGLRFDVEEKLWSSVGKAITRVCKEAKPRRPVNKPMRIEAGTPL
jgi:hypothetical protein